MIIIRKERTFAAFPKAASRQRRFLRPLEIKVRKTLRDGTRFVATNTPGTVIATIPQKVLENQGPVAIYAGTALLPVPSGVLSVVGKKVLEQNAAYNAGVKASTELYAGTPKSIITNIGEILVKGRDKLYRIFTPNASLQQRALYDQIRKSGLRNVHQIANKVDSRLPAAAREMTLKRIVGNTADAALAMPI